jgi:hypothetical protein
MTEHRPEPSTDPAASPGGRPAARRTPDRAPDDSDIGWGERPTDESDEALRRLLEERPPHHGPV